MPVFNFHGEEKLRTNTGGICSILIVVLILVYGLLKWLELMDKKNPYLSSYKQEQFTNEENPINLNAMNSRIAFLFEGFSDTELKDDSRYVKWIVR